MAEVDRCSFWQECWLKQPKPMVLIPKLLFQMCLGQSGSPINPTKSCNEEEGCGTWWEGEGVKACLGVTWASSAAESHSCQTRFQQSKALGSLLLFCWETPSKAAQVSNWVFPGTLHPPSQSLVCEQGLCTVGYCRICCTCVKHSQQIFH